MASKIKRIKKASSTTKRKRRQIMQDLVLLGILVKGPMHGYEIRKEIDQKLIPLVGIRPRSIYYSLEKLEEQGLLESNSARSGKRPKKFVYKLTEEGKREFERLITANLLLVERPCFNLDISLFFFKYADPGSFEKALKKRVKTLQEAGNWDFSELVSLCDSDKEECARMITEHNQRMLKEEIRFSKKLASMLKQRFPEK